MTPRRITGHIRPIRALPALALAGALLAGCGQPPFDSSSAWRPTSKTEGRAFTRGLQRAAPESNFAAFQPGSDEQGDAPRSEVPRRGGENPWATDPRNPVVTVCYGGMLNSADEVRETARRLCPEGSELRLEGQDAFWNGCPLLQPNRAAFRCLTDRARGGGADGDDDDGGGA